MSTKFLSEKRSMFGYGMIIEKSKDKMELKNNLDIIVKNMRNKRQLEEMRDIILYLLKDSLGEAAKEELINKIEIKLEEGDRDMSCLYERLVKEFRQDIRRELDGGLKEQKLKIARKLMLKNTDDKTIIEVTEISQKDLDKLKQKILVEK